MKIKMYVIVICTLVIMSGMASILIANVEITKKETTDDEDVVINAFFDTPPIRSGSKILENEELMYVQKDGSGFEIMWRDQDGSTEQLSSGGPGGPTHFATGDWDGDAIEDYVTCYGSGYSNIFLDTSGGSDPYWVSQPELYFIEFGDYDGDAKDELMYVEKDGSGFKVRWRDQNGAIGELTSGGPGSPTHFAVGDWDCDGLDDYATCYGSGYSNIFLDTSGGSDPYWVSQPELYFIEFGDYDGDSVRVDYTNQMKSVTTDIHPIALMYHPPYKEGINDDLGDTYSMYATGTDSGTSSSNMIGFEAASTFSYEFDIPLLFEMEFSLSIKAGIESTYGTGYEVNIETGRKTGQNPEPYVVGEATHYNQYKYKIINGGSANNGKEFTINIPTGISTSEYELGYYNSHCDPQFQISPQHTSGSPPTYTTLYSHDSSLETPLEYIGQGVRYDSITIREYELQEFALTAGVDFTAGMEAGGFGFEQTISFYSENTHSIETGSSTIFEHEAVGISSDLYDAYKYSYMMYVRRDPSNSFVIIDYYVDPSTLGYAYDDQNPPDTQITGGPTGLIDYDDVSFSWTGSDDSTPTSSLEYRYKFNSDSWSVCELVPLGPLVIETLGEAVSTVNDLDAGELSVFPDRSFAWT